jgi:hypothetical protein
MLLFSACSQKEMNDSSRTKEDFIKDCLKLVVSKDITVFDYIAEHHIPGSTSCTYKVIVLFIFKSVMISFR